MTPFEAYTLYMAIKQHFTTKQYDFVKYNGKMKLKSDNFESRNDKYFFSKLAKKPDPKGFLVANFVTGNNIPWIGDLVNNSKYDEVYLECQKRIDSLTYTFTKDLSQIDDIDGILRTDKAYYPILLTLLSDKKISIETVCILNELMNFLPYWEANINDCLYIFERYKLIIKKYPAFLNFDRNKYKKIVLERFTEDEDKHQNREQQ